MILKTSTFAAVALTIMSCTAQNAEKNSKTSNLDNTVTEQSGKTQYFTIGEAKFIKGLEANITYKSLVEDSRCPEGANCVWAGVAKVNIEFMGTYTRPSTIQLATSKNPDNTPNSFEFNGYKVTLKEVSPHPKLKLAKGEKNTDTAVKKIGLQIEKI